MPADGQIKLDGNDIRHLSANELRHYFGVVPQETVLFSGTIDDKLLMANPHATFDQVAGWATKPGGSIHIELQYEKLELLIL